MKTLKLAALFFMATCTSQASSQSLLEMKTNSKAQCERLCTGLHSSECNMAYYFVEGNSKGFCRFTNDRNPNTQMRGKYQIYSRYYQKWLTSNEVAQINGTGIQPSRQGGSHPCQQVQPANARRFFFRHYGNSGWRMFVQNGGFYCQAPRHKASFNDKQYYGYVTINGKYLTYTECPKGACVTSPLIWKAIHEDNGDTLKRGAVYRDKAQEATAGYLATFTWWQCNPIPAGSNGANMCVNDLVVR